MKIGLLLAIVGAISLSNYLQLDMWAGFVLGCLFGAAGGALDAYLADKGE